MSGRGWLTLVVAFSAVVATACTRRNDGYCCTTAAACEDVGGTLQQCPSGQLCDDDGAAAGTPHACYPDPSVVDCTDDPSVCTAPTPACAGGICVECDGDEDCGDAGQPRCDLDLHRCAGCDDPGQCTRFDPLTTCGPTGACVACAPTDPPTQSASCDAGAPVCGADGACRACEAHAECDSGACDLASGACVDPGQIAYVDRDAGGGGNTCTPTAMCDSIAKGLLTNRPYVVIAAKSYQEDVAVTGRTVTLIGYGADLKAASNGPAVATGGASGAVSIYGLDVHDSPAGFNCDGVNPTSTSSLILVDVSVRTIGGKGGNVRYCDLTMARSRILGATGGGLDLNASGFDIVNSVFSDNGVSGAFGAIRLVDPKPAPARLAFDTIVGNRSGGTGFPGVYCLSTGVTLPAFHSNVITGNTNGGGDTQVNGQPECSYTWSLVNPAVAGTNNVTGDPLLTADFHLSAGSPAIGAAQPGTGVDEDFERQPRDAAPDVGADERAP